MNGDILPLHQEGARLLFEVIIKCYEQRSIIITTNLEFTMAQPIAHAMLFDPQLENKKTPLVIKPKASNIII